MPSRTSMGQPTANASAESNSEMGDEDDLLALLKEILPGMLGMAGMFVSPSCLDCGYYHFLILQSCMHLERKVRLKLGISYSN